VETEPGQCAVLVGQSRRWALGYNLVAVPFAAFGLVPPWLAAIGMSLSSLAVVLNSLRVRDARPQDDPPMALQERAA
jgi:Cu2+-exporting ATPase